MLAVLTATALSPWLVNLAQNFRSHLVGHDSAAVREYYDLSPISGLLTNWSMLLMTALAVVGLVLAIRRRQWLLVLAALCVGAPGFVVKPIPV